MKIFLNVRISSLSMFVFFYGNITTCFICFIAVLINQFKVFIYNKLWKNDYIFFLLHPNIQ